MSIKRFVFDDGGEVSPKKTAFDRQGPRWGLATTSFFAVDLPLLPLSTPPHAFIPACNHDHLSLLGITRVAAPHRKKGVSSDKRVLG